MVSSASLVDPQGPLPYFTRDCWVGPVKSIQVLHAPECPSPHSQPPGYVRPRRCADSGGMYIHCTLY